MKSIPSNQTATAQPLPWPSWVEQNAADKEDLKLTIGVSLSITTLLTCLIFYAIPWKSLIPTKQFNNTTSLSQSYDLEIIPPQIVRPQYFEAAATGNNLIPENSKYESYKNQTAAQETPIDLKELSDTPNIKGEGEKFKKLVSAPNPNKIPNTSTHPKGLPLEVLEPITEIKNLDEPQQLLPNQSSNNSEIELPPGQHSNTSNIKPIQTLTSQSTSQAFETTPTTPQTDNNHTSDQKPPTNSNQEKNESPTNFNAKYIKVVDTPKSHQLPNGLNTPKKRPQVTPTINGPIHENPKSVSKRGSTSMSTTMSGFGEYNNRMTEAISAQWNIIADDTQIGNAAIGSYVVVQFDLTPQGEILDLAIINTNAPNVAALICKDAILSRAPYEPWPEDMITRLNKTEECTITFYYR